MRTRRRYAGWYVGYQVVTFGEKFARQAGGRRVAI